MGKLDVGRAPKISAMENEPRNLTIGTLIRVAHALDSRVEELENRKWKFEIGKEAALEGGAPVAALHGIFA